MMTIEERAEKIAEKLKADLSHIITQYLKEAIAETSDERVRKLVKEVNLLREMLAEQS